MCGGPSAGDARRAAERERTRIENERDAERQKAEAATLKNKLSIANEGATQRLKQRRFTTLLTPELADDEEDEELLGNESLLK